MGLLSEMGHKPAYLRPRRAGGMSAMPARVSDFAAPQRKKCKCQERTLRWVQPAGMLVLESDFWEGTMSTVNFPRRRFLHLAAGAAALPVLSRVAWAQVYPPALLRLS